MTRNDITFEKLNVVPAYKLLADRIAELIMGGTVKAGSPLPTESALCEQFGVNRSTVREGIRLLEETGLLRRVNPKRLVVSRPTKEELGNYLERGLLLHDVTFFELWETAMSIEPQTAALAAVHLQPTDIAALEENVRLTEKAMGDPAELTMLDIEFHALIANSVHNKVWALTREPMARLFYPAFEAIFSEVPESASRLLKAHRSILSVLKLGNAEGAVGWMRKHIEDFKRGFERAGMDIRGPALRPVPRTALLAER